MKVVFLIALCLLAVGAGEPMAGRVVNQNEIYLGGTFFPLSRPVQRTLVPNTAAKVVIGDTTKDSSVDSSALALSDFRGGIGLNKMKGAGEVDRVWYSTANLSHQGHMVLPPLATQIADPGADVGPLQLIEFDNAIFGVWVDTTSGADTVVHEYNNNADDWIDPASATLTPAGIWQSGLMSLRLEGTMYLVGRSISIPNSTRYTTDGSTWGRLPVAAWRTVLWDEKLFFIDLDGQLAYVTSLEPVLTESGTVSAVETNGSAALDDTAAQFTSTIRDGSHRVRVVDATERAVNGFIGTADPDGDDTRVQIFNSAARTTQNWVEGGSTTFDPTDGPLTYEVYRVVEDALLPVQPYDGGDHILSPVSQMFTYQDAGGESIIYVASPYGLFAHDFDNTKFVETELSLPTHRDNGKGAVTWRGSSYISSGLAVYQYQVGRQAVVSLVGPDRDDGLIGIKRGIITRFVPGHNALFAFVSPVDFLAPSGSGRDPWNAAAAVALQDKDISAQGATPKGVFFKPDGLEMYVAEDADNAVDQYTLTTAWDVSTAGFTRTLAIGTEETSPAGIFFKPDGTKMYVVGFQDDEVNEYDLGTAWDISSASHVQALDVTVQEDAPHDVFFRADGKKMYIVGIAGVEVNEYDLGTAWNISTAVALQAFDLSGETTAPTGIFFKPDGTRMYMTGSGSVHQYDLSTAWDVSSAVLVSSTSVTGQEATVEGVAFKVDGTKMYIVGSGGVEVNEYDLLPSPLILAWDGVGWQVLWDEGSPGYTITSGIVANAYNEYRLWWSTSRFFNATASQSTDPQVYFIDLQRDIVNPNQVADYKYAVEAETITPWFDAGQSELNKLALKIVAETIVPDSDDSITISYALDYSEVWTALTAITTSGSTTFTLPNAATPEGVAFRAIRFRIEQERTNDDPDVDKFHSPDLNSLTLVYEKRYPPKFGFTVSLDLSKPYKDKTPAQLQSTLITLIEDDNTNEFTYRNDDSEERNYWVRIRGFSGLDTTGEDERGQVQLQLQAPG
jgi:sugar lactone lactonase YvrE